MQSRGVLYLRCFAAALLIFLVAAGLYDVVQARTAQVTVGQACVPVANTASSTLGAEVSAPYTVASAGSPFAFTVTYPDGVPLTNYGYDVWYLTGATPSTPTIPLRNYALYVGHTTIPSATGGRALVQWVIPSSLPAGNYLIVPTAVNTASGFLLQGGSFRVSVKSDITGIASLVPGVSTSDIASTPGTQAPSVLFVGTLANTTSTTQTVQITWTVSDPTNQAQKADVYYNTVTIPPQTKSMEIAHTFNRAAYSEMRVQGAVKTGDITTTATYALPGPKQLYYQYADIQATHTSTIWADHYTASGCVALPDLALAQLVAKPTTVSLAALGNTKSVDVDATQTGHVVSFTTRRNFLTPVSTVAVTLEQAGTTQTVQVTVQSPSSHAISRLVVYIILILLCLAVLLFPYMHRRTYSKPLV